MGGRRICIASPSPRSDATGAGNRRCDERVSRRNHENILDFSHFTIIPDRGIKNDRTSVLTNMIQTMYVPFSKRWNGKSLDPVNVFAWEIVLIPEEISFNMTVPTEWKSVLSKQAEIVWNKSSIKQVSDPLGRFNPTVASSLELKEHYIFSFDTDKRSQSPLDAILDTVNLMSPLDKAVIQILVSPAKEDWWEYGADAYDQFREGETPKRIQLDNKAIVQAGVKLMTSFVLESFYLFQEFFGIDPERVNLNYRSKGREVREGVSGKGIPEKLRSNAFETTIRIGIDCKDSKRASSIMRALTFAFRELDADNSLVARPMKPSKAQKVMKARLQPIKLNHDYLQESEVLKLIQMPTENLLHRYRIKHIEFQETRIPEILTKEGIYLGETTRRGTKTPLYLPISNHDELCLPHCVIGGMGTGKSLGFGANLAFEALKNGFSAIVVDPAKGEIGDELEKVVPSNKIIRYEFGKIPYALDWREVNHADRAKSRLANAMIEFFDIASDPAGAQTTRYLRSACRVVPDSSVQSVIRLFTDENYLKELLPTMPDIEKNTWEPYLASGEQRRMQIAAPVFNRLDTIVGDEYMRECLESDKGIDLVKLLDEPRIIIFDVNQENLPGREIVNILASMLATKIDIAMFLRRSKFPVFVILDEPHQYLNSATTWKNVAVESRKHRFCYSWLFHAWEQLPPQVAHIIQSAGVNYHIYSTSKRTYMSLAEEIRPFTIEEALETKTHWAINTLRANKQRVEPFMAYMAPPPSMRGVVL